MVPIPDSTFLVAFDLYRVAEQANQEPNFREHLGASAIGEECERKAWYSYRWALRRWREGRVIRLLQRGKREERLLLDDLAAAGYEVDAAPATLSILNGHFGGTPDAIVRGVPAAPKTWHVLEIKTHAEKYWKELTKHGVQEAMPQHYAQMQTYMHLSGHDRALYLAINKNDDSIYEERVHLDQVFAQRLIHKAQRIIEAQHPPERISDKPDWFQCKLCEFATICHGTAAPERNCRTCLHSEPANDGQWFCTKFRHMLDKQDQLVGCSDHLFVPSLLHWLEQVDATDDSVIYRRKDGTAWTDNHVETPK